MSIDRRYFTSSITCLECQTSVVICVESGKGVEERIKYVARQKGWRLNSQVGGWLCSEHNQRERGKTMHHEPLPPKQGAVAICSAGSVGFITSEKPMEVSYPDGNKGIAWTGVHLTDKLAPMGSPWSSRSPHVLFYLTEHTAKFMGEMVRGLRTVT